MLTWHKEDQDMHAVVLVLVMVLQITVTMRHQMSAHAYGSDEKKAYELKCPQLYMHLWQNALPDARRQTMRL